MVSRQFQAAAVVAVLGVGVSACSTEVQAPDVKEVVCYEGEDGRVSFLKIDGTFFNALGKVDIVTRGEKEGVPEGRYCVTHMFYPDKGLSLGTYRLFPNSAEAIKFMNSIKQQTPNGP